MIGFGHLFKAHFLSFGVTRDDGTLDGLQCLGHESLPRVGMLRPTIRARKEAWTGALEAKRKNFDGGPQGF